MRLSDILDGDLNHPKNLPAVFTIIVFTIIDAFFTIELTRLGAEELNPIMRFYLERDPLLFFSVKYALTAAAIFLVLIIKDPVFFGTRIPRHFLLRLFTMLLTGVVGWEICIFFLN